MLKVVKPKSIGGNKHEPVEPFECEGCICLGCNFEGECWCPLTGPRKTPPTNCDNYKRRENE